MRWKGLFDYTKLSREVSYILRHNPDKYGITLDSEGWCSVDDLIHKLSETPLWKGLTRDDLETMIELSDKKRHEIKGEKTNYLKQPINHRKFYTMEQFKDF